MQLHHYILSTFLLGFIGCCCPPIGNFLIAEKLNSEGFEKWIGFLDFVGFGGICSWIGAMTLRGKVREKDRIEGGTGDDCITTCCCLSCSICQMANQIDLDQIQKTNMQSWNR